MSATTPVVFLDKRDYWVMSVPTASGFRWDRLGKVTGMTKAAAVARAEQMVAERASVPA